MKIRSIAKKIRHQAGVTLIEFIAFIGLAALVVGGSLAMYGIAVAGATASDLVTTANGIVLSMRTTFPGGLAVQAYSPSNLNAAGAPAGWGGWTAGAGGTGLMLQKGARQFIVSPNAGGGTFNLTIDTGDNALCLKIADSKPVVGGVPLGGKPCAGGNQLSFANVSLP